MSRVLLVVVLLGCMRREEKPRATRRSDMELATVLIDGVPHIPQKPDFCGEADVAMWLAALGKGGDQDWVFDQSGLDPSRGRGVWARELFVALEKIGFSTGAGWYQVAPDDPGALDALFRELHRDLARGVPSIVCMRTESGSEHFRLVLGYDAPEDEVIYHEPAEAAGAYRRMPRARFFAMWPLKYELDQWTVVRFRLEPKESLAEGQASAARTPADYAQHVIALKEKLGDGFTVVVAPPFVVVGDEAPGAVAAHTEDTVALAVRLLKAAYFEEDPDEILTIWLFKNERSYRHHAREFFGDDPTTPYGYYSRRHKALIMNIATGGGTLVHEIVHPFVEKNFPQAPAWLNEGLGSLYEQCAEVDGKIVGLTNWRLAGLKDAIRAGQIPSFKTLMTQPDAAFYAGSGKSYGQARYLLYYLQENGLLGDFYRRFLAAREDDPSGYATLQTILGEQDMAAFQRRWEEWVLALVFDG